MDNNLPSQIPTTPVSTEGPKRAPLIFWIFIIVALVAAVLGGVYFYLLRTGQLGKLFPTPTPLTYKWSPYTTTPPPIGTGKQQFRISGGVQGLPTIEWIMFDPIDPAMGASQTLTVKANDANPIKAVYVVLHTDNDKDTTYTLTQSAGTPTNGEWKTSFKAENPYSFNYRATIKVQNDKGLFQMLTVTIR